MIHVYTFHKSLHPELAPMDICADISTAMRYEITPEQLESLQFVRVVSPNKVYYCVSFRLPREVAFADIDGQEVVDDGGGGEVQVAEENVDGGEKSRA